MHRTSAPSGGNAPVAPAVAAGPVFVLLKTDRGDVTLELDAAKAPVTVRNFLEYVRGGFYDGTVFHRCLPGFIVQAGSAVFGRVVRGMGVLDRIAAVPTGDRSATGPGGRTAVLHNVPLQPVTILSAKEVPAAESLGTGAAASAPKSPQFSIETIQPGTAK